jgi:hypothetical protein
MNAFASDSGPDDLKAAPSIKLSDDMAWPSSKEHSPAQSEKKH